ncbi:MAG TPA: hypothetical protein GXX24_10605 [Paracoccus solventivorans]|uniref:Lipoprotein n=1 Tax=Paracoccus solventivorans TaxID=53463 RepID=A0A832PPE8_9RHOB|nr:hypothetical protein [Paracoccus solventivorans]HHW34572.1 hypothetical protein [Paracoccus solventivorans]
MPGQAALRVGLSALSLAALAACSGDDDSTFAERQELANTSPRMAVNKAEGSRLVRVFQEFCLDGAADPATRSARLRAAGYVPAGGWRGGMRDFVTNDRRPLVRLTRDGRSCVVGARASTGQTVAVHAAIGRWFPRAAKVRDTGATEIWLTGRRAGEGIGITHNRRGPHDNEIILALMQR